MPDVLPDFISFGEFPFDAFPELQPVSGETAVPILQDVVPLGVDIAFDFTAGEFRFTPGGDLVVASEFEALQQWLVVALVTPRDQEIIYDYRFGSELSSLLGAGGVTDTMVADAAVFIREALLFHDRIISIEDIRYSFSPSGSESLIFYFNVVLDTDDRFQFGGLQVG